MAYIIQDTTLSRIAEAIRAKNGTTDKIKVSDMAATIEAIKAGGDDKAAAIIDRSITEYSNDNIETIAAYAFYQCSSLLSVDMPAATSIGGNAFGGCNSLTTIDLPAATSIGSNAFYHCSILATLDLPAATSIGYEAFSNCSSLTTVSLPAATSIGDNAFTSCNSLATVVLPAATSIGSYVFYNCSSLTTVSLPAATSIGSNAFYYCEKLTTVDLPMATSIGAYVCASCSALKALIIRTGQVCSLDADLGYGTDSCYIYVPRALINDYKAATNWAKYADKFRALEDYTVDGTTTGELDTTKIQ